MPTSDRGRAEGVQEHGERGGQVGLELAEPVERDERVRALGILRAFGIPHDRRDHVRSDASAMVELQHVERVVPLEQRPHQRTVVAVEGPDRQRPADVPPHHRIAERAPTTEPLDVGLQIGPAVGVKVDLLGARLTSRAVGLEEQLVDEEGEFGQLLHDASVGQPPRDAIGTARVWICDLRRYASRVRPGPVLVWLFVGCGSSVVATPTAAPNRAAPSACASPTVHGWTIASGDLSRLPEPFSEPIGDEELWSADFPSAADVRLRRVRLASAPPSRRPRHEWAWVAVVPETCGAFASVDGLWWPVEAYGPPMESSHCDHVVDAYEGGTGRLSRSRWFPRPERALVARCPLLFAPRGAELPPRAQAAITRWRRDFYYEWRLLEEPIEAALVAFSTGQDDVAAFFVERVLVAERGIASEFDSDIERDLLLRSIRALRDELARRESAGTTSTTVHGLLELAAHPDADGETISHREDPRFRSVVAEGSRALAELEACVANEAPRTRYVAADPHGRWQLVSHADLCRAARDEIVSGAPAHTWWDFAREHRAATGP